LSSSKNFICKRKNFLLNTLYVTCDACVCVVYSGARSRRTSVRSHTACWVSARSRSTTTCALTTWSLSDCTHIICHTALAQYLATESCCVPCGSSSRLTLRGSNSRSSFIPSIRMATTTCCSGLTTTLETTYSIY